MRFLLGCVKAAAAAAADQQQQQQLQETLGLLLGAAARVVAAGEGGDRLGLEIGVAIDCLQQNYRAAAAVSDHWEGNIRKRHLSLCLLSPFSLYLSMCLSPVSLSLLHIALPPVSSCLFLSYCRG